MSIDEIIKECKEFNFKKAKPLSGILKDLVGYIESIEGDNAKLREKIRTYSKEEEIEKLEKQLMGIRKNAVAILSEQEQKDYKAFRDKHYKDCNSSIIEIIVTGTGIGDIIELNCKKCGTRVDITDFSNF